MNKYFVTSDIHGFFTLWQNALKEKGFDVNNPNHKLIICGDILDRGEEAVELVNFLTDFPQDRLIFIKGNHEDEFIKLVEDLDDFRMPHQHQISNGTYDTIQQLTKNEFPHIFAPNLYTHPMILKVKRLINRSYNYYEIGNYIFVHGWIPVTQNKKMSMYYTTNRNDSYRKNWRNATEAEWEDARWSSGIKMSLAGINEPNKTIVCGHWHTSEYWFRKGVIKREFPDVNSKEFKIAFNPVITKELIAIDACTAYSGKVNVFVFEEE